MAFSSHPRSYIYVADLDEQASTTNQDFSFLEFVQKHHESRFQSLVEQLGSIAEKLVNDVAISIMKNDPTSAVHVQQRIVEIVDEGLLSEREGYIQDIMHVLATRELELREAVKELAALRAQPDSSTLLRTSVQELLKKVSSTPLNKADIVELNRAMVDLRQSLVFSPFASSPVLSHAQQSGNSKSSGISSVDRIFEQEFMRQDLELQLEQMRTPAPVAEVEELLRGIGVDPSNVAQDSTAARRLREWVGQFNALKLQNKSLNDNLKAAQQDSGLQEKGLLELRAKYATVGDRVSNLLKLEEEREDNSATRQAALPVETLQAYLAEEEMRHAETKRRVAVLQQDLDKYQQELAVSRKHAESVVIDLATRRDEVLQLKNKVKGYSAMLEEVISRARAKGGAAPVASNSVEFEALIGPLRNLVVTPSYRGTPGETVKLHLDMVTRSEHEAIVSKRLAELEAQCYAECRELLRTLEDRKNREYAQAMTAVRQGVKRLEDALEAERSKYRKLDAETLSLRSRIQSIEASSSALIARLEKSENALSSARAQVSTLEQLVKDERIAYGKLASELGHKVAVQTNEERKVRESVLGSTSLTQGVSADLMRGAPLRLSSLQQSLSYSIGQALQTVAAGGPTSLAVAESSVKESLEETFRTVGDMLHSVNAAVEKAATTETRLLKAQAENEQSHAAVAHHNNSLTQLAAYVVQSILSLKKEVTGLKHMICKDLSTGLQHVTAMLLRYQSIIQTKVQEHDDTLSEQTMQRKMGQKIALYKHKMTSLKEKTVFLLKKLEESRVQTMETQKQQAAFSSQLGQIFQEIATVTPPGKSINDTKSSATSASQIEWNAMELAESGTTSVEKLHTKIKALLDSMHTDRRHWKTERKGLLTKLSEVQAEKAIEEARYSDMLKAVCEIVPGAELLTAGLSTHSDPTVFAENLTTIRTSVHMLVEAHKLGQRRLTTLMQESEELKNHISQLQQNVVDRTKEKEQARLELDTLRNSLNSHERILSEQEAKKSQFLKSVAQKDKEISYLTDLLEQSMKQVTVEGIMEASQLEGKTHRLSQKLSKNKSHVEKSK